jgi:hypothetical protein
MIYVFSISNESGRVSIISSPLNFHANGLDSRGYTWILFLKLFSSIYSENFITILFDVKLAVPLSGITAIIVGGVSSTDPPGGGFMDAQEYNKITIIEYLIIVI